MSDITKDESIYQQCRTWEMGLQRTAPRVLRVVKAKDRVKTDDRSRSELTLLFELVQRNPEHTKKHLIKLGLLPSSVV